MPDHVSSGLQHVHFNDSLAAAWGPDNKYLVTSPNVDCIPKVIKGTVTIHMWHNRMLGRHNAI